MPRLFFALLVILFASGFAAADGPGDDDERPLFYTVQRETTVFSNPDSSRAYLRLRFREPVHVLERQGSWVHVRTQDGAKGYVAASAISDLWIRVSKSNKRLYAYRGTELVMQVAADFGYNAFADKLRRGSAVNPDDWRTPDGVFFVVKKNARSQYHKALVLNYPTAEDAERGLKQALISEREYEAIVRAEKAFEMPPMGTALGGMIEIHGDGTGVGTNWTQGCVAIHNKDIDRLFALASVGTPVLIEP